MAEATTGGKSSPLEALKKKVGPLPLGVWLAIGLGVWWYLRKQQSQTGPGGTAANGTTATGYGTDPAGNTGYIDPSTGYVYGSAEDVAALQSQGLVGAPGTGSSYNTGGSGDTSGTGASGSSTGGGTTATGSGTGTTTPDGSGTGATGGTTTPGTPPASTSKNWRYPAPGGLHSSNVSDSGFGLAWSPVTGPGGQKPSTYTVATYQGSTKVDQFVSGATSTKEYGAGGKGLKPSTTYRVNVWANGGPLAPPHSTVVVTTKAKGSK